jgi:uncharacterized protein
MGNIDFGWDLRKARSNPVKPGVSFEAAQSVFLEESARPDRRSRPRVPVAGYRFQARCLFVSHCYRESDSVVRLISARRATASEVAT